MTTQSDPKNPVASPRKGAKTGVVSELSVFLKVKPGHEKQIREVFTSAAAADAADQGARAHKELESVGTLHEARQVLFDNDTRLLIATSFDGDWDVYIDDFARTSVLQDWAEFLVHCEGYPDAAGVASLSLDEQKEFLTAYQVTAALYDRSY
ncbi:MAG: hypothetical protein ACJ797_00040, partial [Ktedonobacteraceae bacterium]